MKEIKSKNDPCLSERRTAMLRKDYDMTKTK